MLTGEGKHLRVGGRAEAAEEHANEQQNEVVAVPGEQRTGQHAKQAAEDDQVFAVAAFIRIACQKLADENADHRAAGKEKTDHRRADVDLITEKQAQRRRLQRTGNTG